MAGPKSKPKGEAKLTAYVVLRRAEVREEPVEDNPVTEEAWLPVTELVEDGPEGQKAWALKVFDAAGKAQAIRAHTGDGADVVEGSWRAIPMSSWRGGETTRRTMKSERLPLEEAMA